MGLAYDIPEYKRIRVIIDSDAACEADDPFAIAHALMSKSWRSVRFLPSILELLALSRKAMRR